ncbi:MAG: tetratricopeptide repeat protein [Opitutaceae bacterium]|nr:tetratricopeptide repeat protein [Opitutaceae bacterium]
MTSRTPASDRRPLLLGGLIALATVLAFWGVGACGFVNLDDDAYVEHQPLVNQGLRAAGVAWAFTGVHSSNWHPLTTLSHMLDCELFGVRAAPMHWENLLWHTLNALLVFVVWRALTGALWRPAFVAALFALHPLHVESVAWISERKDLLCAFFWLLGLWAYAGYVRRPTAGRMGLVGGAMILSLLSKPMAVTFPCTLLLLDFWPLRRWPGKSWLALFREKLPLFGLVAAHSVLTWLVQSGSGAAQFGERFSVGVRAANALVSYVRYLGKTVWPETLAPLYFHPGHWPPLFVAGAAALLAALTWLGWRLRHTQPAVLFGWLFFLGTLVPVIGLVQVGAQALADRYMYLPILGLLTAGAWPAAALVAQRDRLRPALVGIAALLLLALGLRTARQVPAWRGSVALYTHSIASGEDNAAVRYLLAVSLAAAGRPATEVEAQFRAALRLRPDYVNALTQLAMIAIATGRFDDARRHIEESLRAEPGNPNLHVNRGALAVRAGRPDEAVPHFERALQLDPRNALAHSELAQIRFAQKRLEDAAAHYAARARGDRWNPDALTDYAATLCHLGRPAEALPLVERALWIAPGHATASRILGVARELLAKKS